MGIRVTEIKRTSADDFDFSYSPLLVFDHSTSLLEEQEGWLFISSDNGVNWKKSDEISDSTWLVDIDEHYRNSRAVVTADDGGLYLTEDQGKHWRKLNLPKLTSGYYELDTHPFEKDYLLARCEVSSPSDDDDDDDDDDRYKLYSYVSNDGGKNFRKIESPNSKDFSVTCEFACKSRDSIFSSNKDLVYCLDGEISSFSEFQPRDVFYTDDFGKSVNFIDQFMDHTVLGLRILDSHVLVFTLENQFDEWSTANLWVSNDGFTFGKAFLPTVLRDPDTWRIIEDELGRIIIPTSSSLREEQASPIFISDPSGLQFRFLDIGIKDTLVGSSRLTTSKTLKGTMLAHLTLKPPDRLGCRSRSKMSFDYGNTWSNLRVIRSPNQREDLFPCDVDDVENCSLEPLSFFNIGTSQTAGILMTTGTVGKDVFQGGKEMTFISRDGGRSWEVAFECPCRWAFGDGGNIIVAIRSHSFGDNVPKGEFYYSLDQGKTWKKYQVEAPIYLSQIISTTSDDSGLNFIISGVSQGESFFYIVDFTGAFNGQSCCSKGLET